MDICRLLAIHDVNYEQNIHASLRDSVALRGRRFAGPFGVTARSGRGQMRPIRLSATGRHRIRKKLTAWGVAALALGGLAGGVAGCSRGADGSVSSGISAIPSAVPSTISVAEAAPKAGAPVWCRTIDSPTVTALANVLPQLVTDEAVTTAPKVRAAATVLHNAAASAAAEPGRLLTAAADSLDAAADAKSATSLQVVGTAFTSMSKGVQSACGFH